MLRSGTTRWEILYSWLSLLSCPKLHLSFDVSSFLAVRYTLQFIYLCAGCNAIFCCITMFLVCVESLQLFRTWKYLFAHWLFIQITHEHPFSYVYMCVSLWSLHWSSYSLSLLILLFSTLFLWSIQFILVISLSIVHLSFSTFKLSNLIIRQSPSYLWFLLFNHSHNHLYSLLFYSKSFFFPLTLFQHNQPFSLHFCNFFLHIFTTFFSSFFSSFLQL